MRKLHLTLIAALAAALCAVFLAGPAAAAQPVTDVIERYVATHQSIVSRPPDIQDTATAVNSVTPDLVERFVSIDPYELASVPASRPPDISDAALAIRYGSATANTTSFNWHDWAIGTASGLGLAFLLGCTILMARQLRHRAQTI